jgi:hypothetical protein
LTLIAACLFTASGTALAVFIVISLLGNPYAYDAYLWLGLAMCMAWITGVWLLTNQQFRSRYGKLNWLRLTTRWAAFLWLPGHVLWMFATMWFAGTVTADAMLGWSLLIRSAAGVGGLFFASWLMLLANDAELDDASRHIHLAIWMLPIPTVMLAMLPDQIQWIFLAVIGMVLLIWCWFVAMMGRGVLAMQRHVSWGLRIAAEAAQRDSRLTQKRAELQREADAQIRPVQQQADADISIQPRRARS